MNPRPDTWHKFFADFYGAIATADPWTGVAASAADFVGRSRVVVGLYERQSGTPLQVTSAGTPSNVQRLYYQYQGRDVVTARAMRVGANRALTRDEFIPWSDFRNTEFYNEFHRPAGIQDLSGIVVDEGPLRLLVYLFDHGAEAPLAAAAPSLEQLAPHLKTALRLRSMIHPPQAEARTWRAELLQRQFNLTPSEARVAMMLSSGLPTKEIARQLGLQPNSIRSQLKAIFAKTDTHSQVELVHLLLADNDIF